MDTAAAAPAPSGVLARGGAWLAAESGLVVLAAAYAAFWAAAAPLLLQADSWLTFLGGREIIARGIPHDDGLTVMTSGRTWIDQQWLAQLVFYWVVSIGGVTLAVLLSVALLLSPLAFAIAFARQRAATVRSIVLIAILCVPYVTSFLRAQLFSHVLFVILVALLAAESRAPSRRILLVFPMLALWANLHGAALLGAALVALLGLCELARLPRPRARGRMTWARASVLVLAPWPCLLATPYGLSIAEYYRATLGNPGLAEAIDEWKPPVFLTFSGFPFFVLAGLALVLVARRSAALTRFELSALALTLVGSLAALRSITWFAYASLMFLPALLERAGKQSHAPRRAWLPVASAAAATGLALVTHGTSAIQLENRSALRWPEAVPARLADVLREDPGARVFASHEFGDWLLYARPELRGRLAFDGRWELLSPPEIRSVVDYFEQAGGDWEALSRGYRVLVFNAATQPHLDETYGSREGVSELFRNERVVVYVRPRTDARQIGLSSPQVRPSGPD